MKSKAAAQKFFTILLAGGATLAIGFLSFAGMFLLSSSVVLCAGAFVLAAAYEGQVNSEGVSTALRRIFNKNYLKLGLIRKYLDDLLEQENLDNEFLEDYRKQKKYLESFGEMHHATAAQLKEKSDARKKLDMMELFFLKQLEKTSFNNTKMARDVEKLLVNDREKLLTEMNRKKWIIRVGSVFALGGGVSCFFATFSAMHVGIAAFAIMSAVPGGVLVALAALAAAGYTLLLYQSISDMVQEFSGKWQTYFERRVKDNESKLGHALRCVGTVLAVALGIFATIATAGTWWYAVKNGAALLKIASQAADTIRNVSVSMMAVSSFIFNASNSSSSVDNISRSNYKMLAENLGKSIKNTWETDKITKGNFQAVKSVARFINPFRFVEKFLTYSAKGILFLGHIVSMALMSDNFPGLKPEASIPPLAINEAGADLNYMPDSKKEHNHDSKLLAAIFLPVTLAVIALKSIGTVWDFLATGCDSFAESKKRMFAHDHQETKVAPKPVLSEDWKVIERQERQEKHPDRLNKKRPAPLTLVKSAKDSPVIAVVNSTPSSKNTEALPLLANQKTGLWFKKPSESETSINRRSQHTSSLLVMTH
jgi:hypothetical protein